MQLFNSARWNQVAATFLLVSVILPVGYAATSSPATDENKNTTTDKGQNLSLSNLYTNPDSRYKINYPAKWIFDDTVKGAVVFSGQKNTPDFFSTINIQTVLTKKSGGIYETVDDLLSDVKKQARSESPQTAFLEDGAYVLNLKDGTKLSGEYLKFIYSYKGQIIEQWQIVVPRKDGQVFYTWAYTAPIAQYQDNLTVAKAMLQTWTIY